MPQTTERIKLPEPYNSKVGQVIEEIEDINSRRAWFIPRTLDESEYYLSQIMPFFAELKESFQPFVFNDQSLRQSWHFARDSAYELAEEYHRKLWWDEAWKRTNDASLVSLKRAAANAISGDNRRSAELTHTYNNLIKNTGVILGRIAAWEVVSDLPELEGLQNPDRVLLEFYKRGLVFIDLRYFNDKQVPVAHQIVRPSADSPERYLVCLIDNQTKIKFKHGLNRVCKDAVEIN
ncbi:MAG: hypothetical protein ACD_30C00089G0002 [uncultured bacterium]|uniref:Uncharacterized protein n=3 Tax=Candidatus Daviesiibacteriota TaxID=1752718 RepID=A0A0G0FA87_9BACT|nr:MAG: hypothetical protein ACD_30C00089G0002 [uncultured bacterium]KKQ10465.1 MAG: hypothetical protein US19_C0004G0013 [Candidatus Daviesbacteria bacterium GW2011_GWB1_36_5]KKQ16197.1 MAG: hypothetical protein US28_C0004G0039 [Candidatus Daviesbacteria bacterium GW2011_GWA1_36_8]OGE36172.1 MAG: hypothetical protein A3E66_05185 [Candidatus Daviesbacteria bacterium RIFCSPHIGHO2_12_FULL_37_16]